MGIRPALVVGAVAASLCVASSGCSGTVNPPGGVMLAFSTDMSIPKDVDTLHLEITQNGAPLFEHDYPVGPNPAQTLPATLLVPPPKDPTSPLQVRVVGVEGRVAHVLRDAIFVVPTNQIVQLHMPVEWLCEGSGVNGPVTTDGEPTYLPALCPAGQTCAAGSCVTASVSATTLPPYDPATIFGGGTGEDGGGGGTCFDTVSCFGDATLAAVDRATCTFTAPSGGVGTNVAVLVGSNVPQGICGPEACLIPLDGQSAEGWQSSGGTIQLPAAVCSKLASGAAAGVLVSTACATKTASEPTCGPWSSVSGGLADAGQNINLAPIEDAGQDTSVSPIADAAVDAEPRSDATVPPPDAAVDSGPAENLDATMPADSSVTPAEDAGADAREDAGAPDTGVDATLLDSGSSGGADAADDAPTSGDDAGSCTMGEQKCIGSGISTCDATGTWGASWPCATGTCSGAACVGTTTAATSCADGGSGLSNCGASSESCCTSLEVPGGTYDRTYDPLGPDGGWTLADDGGPTGEGDPATVSGFRLDKYEVTVGRFRQFVNAWNGGSGFVPLAGSGKHTHLNAGAGLLAVGEDDGGIAYEQGWSAADDTNITPTDTNLACQEPYATWTNTATTQENLPINCVTWADAYAFCIWDGGFLPSEAEWEYAAAGGSQQREYPWGSTPPGTNNQYAIYGDGDCYYPGPGTSCTGVANIAPVGFATQGAGAWGHLDMAGNVVEWSLDWYASSYVDPCPDCAYLHSATDRVLHGGSFFGVYSPPEYMLPPTRSDTTPTFLSNGVGFRCARTP